MNNQPAHINGIIIRRSDFPVKETIDRLEDYLRRLGATIYARINQQNEAYKVGLKLSPLEFLLFGNPKGGVPVMQQNPLAALDLPLKIIAWEDNQGLVWIAFNEAAYLEERYSLAHNAGSPLNIDRIVDHALGE